MFLKEVKAHPLKADITTGNLNFHQIILLNLQASGAETFNVVYTWERIVF